MKLYYKKNSIYLFVGLFLLLLLSFNISLNPTFFGINGIYMCMIASVICILLYQNNYGGLSLMTIRVNRSSVIIWSALLLPILINNQEKKVKETKIRFDIFPQYAILFLHGALAQLGARHTGSVEVTGSSPVCSIFFITKIDVLIQKTEGGKLNVSSCYI